MQGKYRLFQQVYCWLGNDGLARGTVSAVNARYTTEFAWPMGKPILRYSYDIAVEGIIIEGIDEDFVGLSKVRLERLAKDAEAKV